MGTSPKPVSQAGAARRSRHAASTRGSAHGATRAGGEVISADSYVIRIDNDPHPVVDISATSVTELDHVLDTVEAVFEVELSKHRPAYR